MVTNKRVWKRRGVCPLSNYNTVYIPCQYKKREDHFNNPPSRHNLKQLQEGWLTETLTLGQKDSQVQLPNAKRIVVEDFKQDQRESISKLAEIINPFMEDVVELVNGNIGIDNLVRTIVKIDITVDTNGKPQGVSQINTGLQTYSGSKIINTQAVSGGDSLISAPYIDCTYQGNGLVKVNKIYGLVTGKKLRVTIEFIG